jgi:hypothetical protein
MPSTPQTSRSLGAVCLVLLLAIAPGCATFAEYGSEQKFGVGVRGNVALDRVVPGDEGIANATLARLELNGSVHRFFPSEGTWTEANADMLLPLIRVGGGAARTYVGTGLSFGRFEPDVGPSDTKLGANLIGGLRFEQRTLAPFFEVRGSLGGAEQLSAVLGFQLFGGSF